MRRGAAVKRGLVLAIALAGCGGDPPASDGGATTGSDDGGGSDTQGVPMPGTSDSGVDSSGGEGSDDAESSGGPPVQACNEGLEVPRPRGVIPNVEYPEEMQGQAVSPTLANVHHNQPTVLDGYLMLAGNARFSTWDMADLEAPEQLSNFQSEHGIGEAESHQLSLAKVGENFYAATISGRGFDIWDMTDMTDPSHVSHTEIEGINYGDIAAAVWGVAWQGTHVYVGGNDTGLHIVDVSDVTAPVVVNTLPNSATGGFFVGPVFAMGNILVLTTPKEHGGLATMEISDPENPVLLDSVTEAESYIGWYYGGHVILQTPLRIFDVLSDPTTISPVLEGMETVPSEYVSFGDDRMFLGLLRPSPGAIRFDVADLSAPVELDTIEGRELGGNDDQFTLKAGNLLVLSDDQLTPMGYAGTYLAVESPEPDETPPVVNGVWPPDGLQVPATTAIGLSFSDQIELATVDTASFYVRELDTAEAGCITGSWGHMRTILNFTPDAPLTSGVTYEVVLPAGGITDLGGNAIAEEFRTTFTVL
ncbi:MAG: Ig-like domain-containing protein [Myxococcota bacterium]